MNTRPAVIGLIALTALYLSVLVWADSNRRVFAGVPALASAMPVLIAASVLSYLIRYARWHWLLRRAGHAVPVLRGFAGYIAGFAFTATPGKVGELLRIRYYEPLGVPPARIISAFVFERLCDLLAVLALAAFALGAGRHLAFATAFVLLFASGIAAFAFNPGWLTWLADALHLRGRTRPAAGVRALRDGLTGCRTWLTAPDVIVSLGTGVLAWLLASLAFVWLLGQLDLPARWPEALATYPLAMLLGAASMLPGGVGSTEVATVTLLALQGAPVAGASVAAVGIRLSSLWFAIVCGLLAMTVLEMQRRRSPARARVTADRGRTRS